MPKIGTIVLHLKQLTLGNKRQFKGPHAVRHIAQYAHGKFAPTFTRAFAPAGMPTMSDTQI
eukprot:3303850-Pleurochrysis_carterae.AAC.1